MHPATAACTLRPATLPLPGGVAFVLLLAFALVLRLLLLPGFGGTDDVTYALRGGEIAHGIWRQGVNTTELRYGINLPIAAFAHVFGGGTLALTGWSLLCSVAEVGLVAWFGAVAWGRAAGLATGFVLAVMPLHIVLGGRTLADAPLALFITLGFVAFATAERSGRRATYFAAGLALGACWWIKPTVAPPLYLALALYALVARRLDARWLLVGLGCALMIAAEMVFLKAVSDDALSTLKALLPFLQSHREVRGDPMWGSSSPWFYFRRMFLDGREMWLVPFVAVAGAALLARRLAAARRGDGAAGATAAADRYVLFWTAALLGMFSFFVFSLHPLRFIPKQENYASIFLAPLALLAGAALARLRPAPRALLAVVLAIGGLLLAGIEQQSLMQKYSRMVQAVDFAASRPDAAVLVSAQTATAARMRELTGHGVRPSGIAPLSTLDRGDGAAVGADERALFMVLEPSMPERGDAALWPRVDRLVRCAEPWRELRAGSAGAGVAAVRLAGWLRQRLPAPLGRQLGFVDPVLDPPAATVLAVPATCRAAAAAQ